MTNRDELIDELKSLLEELTEEELSQLVEHIRLNPSAHLSASSPSREAYVRRPRQCLRHS